MEEIIMNNEVMEKVLQFLNQLRCEHTSRKSAVKIPGLKEVEQETENLFAECSLYVDKLSEKEKQSMERWFERQEELSGLREQNAYCQGYVDCVLLLSGLGLLKEEISIDNFINHVNQ